MSLSPVLTPAAISATLCVAAAAAYGLAAWPARATREPLDDGHIARDRWPWGSVALAAGWLLHLATLMVDISGGVWLLDSLSSAPVSGPRLGFAPVLSASAWLVIAVHAVESRFVPVPSVRIGLAGTGVAVIAMAWFFPGEARPFATVFGPWHFILGVASYALIAAAVLHGLWLGAAETRLRRHRTVVMSDAAGAASPALGMPLLQLERLTFRFVQAGFAVLTMALLLGMLAPRGMRIDHKAVFSLLAWACFAVLLWGRATRGWRGRVALRWLYGGAALLLLAYAGSRFVFEVLLGRPWQ